MMVGFQKTRVSVRKELGAVSEMLYMEFGRRTWLVYRLGRVGHLNRMARFGFSIGCAQVDVLTELLLDFVFVSSV